MIYIYMLAVVSGIYCGCSDFGSWKLDWGL